MSKVYIFDFDDSFTFNIANRLFTMNLDCQVIEKSKHEQYLKKILSKKNEKICLILGPGPGHPGDYPLIQAHIKRLMKQQNVLLFGICLGHQILMKELGFKILKKIPAHGIPFNIKLKKKSILVQQYNSLYVRVNPKIVLKGRVLHEKEEILGLISDRLVSWQFHPESVGTSCPLRFFSSLPNFLYNSKDASKKKNQD